MSAHKLRVLQAVNSLRDLPHQDTVALTLLGYATQHACRVLGARCALHALQSQFEAAMVKLREENVRTERLIMRDRVSGAIARRMNRRPEMRVGVE